MKIGIFGGTFDPFTDAHEAIVKKVLDEKLVDKVIIVPTVVDYYRNPDDKWLTDEERMDVISNRVTKMFEDGYQVVAHYDEIYSHEGAMQKSYRNGRRFYHTLVDIIDKENSKGAHDYQFYTIIGTDQYNNFKSWFMWKELLDLTKLIVVNGRCGGTLVNYDDVPCIEVNIDQKYMFTSATEIRREYKGTVDAVNRYINRQPPLREKLLHHTPIFDLVEKAEVQPGFRPVGINAPDWVTVVIRDRDHDKYLMVGQTRYGTMNFYKEFVCGQVEEGEDPSETAKREMKEETGFGTCRLFYPLGTYATNPAFMNNHMHFFLVEVDENDKAKATPPQPDEHEKITTEWVDGKYVNNITGGPAFLKLAVALVKDYDNAKRGN